MFSNVFLSDITSEASVCHTSSSTLGPNRPILLSQDELKPVLGSLQSLVSSSVRQSGLFSTDWTFILNRPQHLNSLVVRRRLRAPAQ